MMMEEVSGVAIDFSSLKTRFFMSGSSAVANMTIAEKVIPLASDGP